MFSKSTYKISYLSVPRTMANIKIMLANAWTEPFILSYLSNFFKVLQDI